MTKEKREFQKIEKKDIEQDLYWWSILGIILVSLLYLAVYFIAKATGINGMTSCMMKRVLGIPCPGCGGTRALICLLHGKIFASLYYNAFATYSAVLYGIFFVTQTIQRISRGKIKGMKYHDKYLILALIILVCQYLLKLMIPAYQI